MKIGQLIQIKKEFKEADFWVIRRGSAETVGTPTKEYNPEHYGIKVLQTDILVPGYLFYVFQFLQIKGDFRRIATGSTNLVNITKDDIENIQLQQM